MRGLRILIAFVVIPALVVVIAALVVGRSQVTSPNSNEVTESTVASSPVRLTTVIEERVMEHTIAVQAEISPAFVWTFGAAGQLPDVVTATSALASGDTVTEGTVLLELGGSPVILIVGDFPAWRDFRLGMDPGPDVHLLEVSLARLGVFSDEPDDIFTRSTRSALRALGERVGYSLNDELAHSQLFIVPMAMAVVDSVPSVGDSIVESPMRLVSRERSLRASLDSDQLSRLEPGDEAVLRDAIGNVILESRVATVAFLDGAEGDRSTELTFSSPLPQGVRGAISLTLVVDRTHGPVLVLPPISVRQEATDRFSVLILENGQEVRLPVDVVFTSVDGIGVTSSDSRLADGTEVVLNPRD